MKQRLKNTALITLVYLLIANSGNFIFGVNERFDWKNTLWEALFFFVFIFLLLGYRNNKKK